MDIAYLLTLQNLRESLPSFIEKFFLLFSYIGDGPALIAIALIIYWCIDKRMGLFALACFSAGNFVNQLVKNIACVYRPWIRDASIVPSPDAIEGAGGYSFPSGHTTGVTTILGSVGWLTRKKNIVITVACFTVIAIIGFSRNFLGVHTPQDVIVGLALAIAMIALTNMFFNWLDRYDHLEPGHNKDVIVTAIVFAACVLSLIIVVAKPYPMDYVDGQLLVDPQQMQKGSFEAAGVFMGLSLAWLLERRFVDFSIEGLNMRDRIIRAVIGVIVVGATYVIGSVAIQAILPYLFAKFLTYFLVMFMAVFVAPILFGKFETRA